MRRKALIWLGFGTSPRGELIKRFSCLGSGTSIRRLWDLWSSMSFSRVSVELFAEGKLALRISWSGPV